MDREKTINELEQIKKFAINNDMPGLEKTIKSAIELLKEQEAVEPKTGHWNGSECSNCHAIFVRSVFDKPEYCSHCGAKMERTGEVE